MWLYLIAIVLLVVGLIGGVLTGGIFLIVFIPLGVIMLIVAASTGMLGRMAERRGGTSSGEGATGGALPHTPHASGPETPATPDDLVDARRRAQ